MGIATGLRDNVGSVGGASTHTGRGTNGYAQLLLPGWHPVIMPKTRDCCCSTVICCSELVATCDSSASSSVKGRRNGSTCDRRAGRAPAATAPPADRAGSRSRRYCKREMRTPRQSFRFAICEFGRASSRQLESPKAMIQPPSRLRSRCTPSTPTILCAASPRILPLTRVTCWSVALCTSPPAGKPVKLLPEKWPIIELPSLYIPVYTFEPKVMPKGARSELSAGTFAPPEPQIRRSPVDSSV
mmetsp:Transcript_22233/g.36804  ORF Transcript_22233/g.36804 Transcript_22233/m.36804 type:complete len:243 (-) Transcript_22233:2142-2870(-)